ncbi:hypothetical protein [Actinoplanes regularis]|uniref:Uncharacterized protein n=1 Tax=Actinoplanes regularis TaxID=52697 RepID=A0A238YND4_9ACTN|nr:hypothetical protein [Actinoplanes regularis]GIE85428.1 hypothetical protein Are01nite_19080 [Actinoplanes regularis]SNR72657.1 hypothetical protein SAMN06264365_10549 [Actinoplanes regularis]
MNGSTSATPTLCRRCGQIATGDSGTCPHCGSPLNGAAGPSGRDPGEAAHYLAATGGARAATEGRSAPVTTADGSDYRFEPAVVAPGPRLSPKGWLTVGAAGTAVVLALVAFVLFWPDPPSPAGTVEEYFDRLGSGDTEAALALVDTGRTFSPDEAPLLVAAALANAGNRPADVEVTAAQPYLAGSRYTVVTARYTIGEQPVEQDFAVVETGDDETPYLLQKPFLYLTVALPGGLDVAVNGVAVDAATVARGTPVFPAAYQATTSGNALFEGTTRAATYSVGNQGDTVEIDLARLDVAPGAQGAVQAATEKYLDGNCVNPSTSTSSYTSQCPLQAPSMSWSQTTSWAITAYPQVQVSSGDQGRARMRFATGTSGSADYTITYTDFSGAKKTETGTVPIDVSGSVGIGEDGAIAIALGY